MAHKIEDAFDSEGILEHGSNDENTYWFSLKNIPTTITVTLSKGKMAGLDGYNFKLSHYINTPQQAGPYRPSRQWGDDKAYALHQAVSAITDYYDMAIENGDKPSAEWLIKA
ncbi:hypothetical protein ACU7RR_002342 [Providencia stuartii]|uniref:Uncharacterized protein n=1 Tax=Providencia stuartii (strain MRSN 2154) TaxID=1157951 RepID=A0A140NFP1_PROSM|nr:MULTISPECIES: hypothetical protein [Providencia]AFH91925.1 hypothetical protein S70_00100 [Providencia stuartii MRSN 2154]MDE8744689.1 hypothetical protein [Providencia thailandensis]MDE8765909.1 hypothetical protein [Providencia thailandensis]MDE8778357.1 hypothetical protein [Providencia thailandensis]MDE8782613.1 hypothetical protein [Providencia thailandensis]